MIIPGGSGQVGMILSRSFAAEEHEVVILSRETKALPFRVVQWDAETLGPWADEIDESDVVINLAGRSVNCRYNTANRREII